MNHLLGNFVLWKGPLPPAAHIAATGGSEGQAVIMPPPQALLASLKVLYPSPLCLLAMKGGFTSVKNSEVFTNIS